MKQLCPTLLFFLFSCWNHVNCQSTPTTSGKDPYFIETNEIRSSKGPRTITRNLLQDRNGTIWFATWQGIMGYDGKTFTNYTLKENLIHFHVFYIFEDRKGNIWFCTVRGGVYKYDGKSFTLFTTKDGLNDNTVNSMAEDPNGNIWFGTWAGANRYDGNTFTSFKKNEGLCDNWVNAILTDRAGKTWFGTNEGIYLFDEKSGFSNFTNPEGNPFKNVRALLEDREGKIWIRSAGGLLHYNGKVFSDTLLSYSVNYLCEDHTGNLWINAVKQGTPLNTCILYRYDHTALSSILEKNKPGDWQIFGIIEDNTHNIWFGTMEGVCRFDVSRENHPCVKNTCSHNLFDVQDLKAHQREVIKTFQYFK